METGDWFLRCAKRRRLAKGIGLSEIIGAAVGATHVTQPLPLVLVMDTQEPPIYICVNSINGDDIVLYGLYLGLNLNFGEDESETRERKVRERRDERWPPRAACQAGRNEGRTKLTNELGQKAEWELKSSSHQRQSIWLSEDRQP